MFEQNSYQAYAEASYDGANPIQLVTALYQGAIEGAVAAQACFASGDIMGRSRAVTKVVNILTELMVTLDLERGGEMALNLKRLYSYMQQRMLAAHLGKKVEPVKEVEGLLRNLVEAWFAVAKTAEQEQRRLAEELRGSVASPEPVLAGGNSTAYGYLGDNPASEDRGTSAGLAYSF